MVASGFTPDEDFVGTEHCSVPIDTMYSLASGILIPEASKICVRIIR
jgi:hypothetical protein